MAKDKFDDELTLLDKIRDTLMYTQNSTYFLTDQSDERDVAHNLLNKINQKFWINSSGKKDPPPDFYSEEFGLMADIMQINDSEKTKGKNIQRRFDSKSYDDLINSGILDMFPNLRRIEILNPCIDIGANQHHKYSWYIKSFERIVQTHKDSIKLYRKNHPNYKLIFVIYDDSEPYCQLPACLIDTSKIKSGDILQGECHLPFLDKNIMKIFNNTDIDYVVWYMNNKEFECVFDNGTCKNISSPKIVVFKPSELDERQFKDYFQCRMISTTQ